MTSSNDEIEINDTVMVNYTHRSDLLHKTGIVTEVDIMPAVTGYHNGKIATINSYKRFRVRIGGHEYYFHEIEVKKINPRKGGSKRRKSKKYRKKSKKHHKKSRKYRKKSRNKRR